MKKIATVVEVEGEGLVGLLGEKVVIICTNYIYSGTLTGVNDADILLDDASIVYETGSWADSKWRDAQKLPSPFYVRTSAIESYGRGK